MLTLILGPAKSGKTQRLFQMVRECPTEGMSQRIIIVPEQLSHQTERKLCALCGNSISYSAEVLSFQRLASRVFALYGGGAKQRLDMGGRMLTMRLALDSIHAQLKVFASSAGKADFLTDIIDMVNEFKLYEVTPRRLMELSRRTEGMFAEKLRELSLILGAYEAVMAQGVCDPRDELTLLKNKLEEHDFAAGRHFYFDGFSDFSGQEQEIIRILLRKGESVTVALLSDEDGSRSVFSPARDTERMLRCLAEGAGISVREIRCRWDCKRPAELTYMERHLFSHNSVHFDGGASALSMYSAADRLEECRQCAAVLRDSAARGTRWRDMYIAAGDTASYVSVMEAVCREYEIPLYTGIKSPITAHPAVAFLLCALEAAADGMEQETVMAYLRTGFSGISKDDCDKLENYAFTWRIRGSKWQSTWTEHPDGYDGRHTESTMKELSYLNEIRVKAVTPLLKLMNGLKTAGNTMAQIHAVYEFLEQTDLFEQMNTRVTKLTTDGKLEQAQEEAQVFNTLLECLQQMANVVGKTAQNRREFLKLVRLALEQYTISTIPATIDSVHFGDISSVRGSEPKLLYVLGMNEGVVPAASEVKGLLTQRERGILTGEMELDLAPDREGILQRELLQIYGAFSAPTERLCVSWVRSDSGETKHPSYLAQRLRAMFPSRFFEINGLDSAITTQSLAELYFTAVDSGENALAEAIRRTAAEFPAIEQKLVDARAAGLPRSMDVTCGLTGKLFGEPVALTASRLDALGNCPLSFFLNYGLKARKRKEASFDAAEFGNFVHYILEKTVGKISGEGVALPISEETSRAMVRSYMTPYLETRLQDTDTLSPRQKYLYDRNEQEAAELLVDISKEFAVSDFRPCAFELQFGEGKALPPLNVQGKHGTGHLDGMVDRADLWKGPDGEYLRVVDYKSGTKKFDYTDLTGGVGMQMLLYLFALCESGMGQGEGQGELTPSGVLYFPAKRDVLAADKSLSEEELDKLRLKKHGRPTGVVLSDEQVLTAMEHDMSGRYTPISKKKADFGDYAITPEQMKILQKYITERMGQAVDQITDGDFAPKPFYRGQSHDPCKWCDFGAICQKDAKFRKEHYVPGVNADKFWQMIGGEENE